MKHRVEDNTTIKISPMDMDIYVVCCRGISDMWTEYKGRQWINRTERKKEKKA
jgi:hypothetical protein